MGKIRLWAVVFVLAIFIGSVLPAKTNAATLSELLRRQQELQQKAENSRKQIEQKKREAATLQDAISSIEYDISYTEERIQNTEEQIEATNAVITALSTDIGKQQSELDYLNAQLRKAYISLYEMSQTSTLEIILTSDSLDSAITQAQYVQELQSDLKDKVVNVSAIKSDLESKKQQSESQKQSLVDLNNSLTSTRRSLGNQRNQKSYLLDVTQNEKTKYEELLKQIQQENNVLSDEIYRKRQELGGTISTTGNGGYPYTSTSAADPWGFIQRQCTSYAAWRWNVIDGNSWFRGAGPVGTGDARNWPTILAPRNGYATGSAPRAGSLVVWPAGPYIGQWGHVAYVEKVNSNGTINVSEYNWVKYSYSYRTNVDPTDSRYGNPTYIYP